MRSILAGAAVAAALGLAALPTSAAPLTLGGGEALGPGVVHIQYERSRYCERLRRACRFKDERGETGEGNCRKYREECRN
jgi:hypothetical protein